MRLYFIAIVAPKSIDDYVRARKEEMQQQYGCKAALKSPAHITIVPPFKMEEVLEQNLIGQLDSFSREQGSFKIILHNYSAFKPRVIYVDILPSQLLNVLHERINKQLASEKRFNIIPEQRSFHPHVTIATRDLRKEDFHKAWEQFKMLNYEASFTATDIALLRNTPGRWDIIHRARFKD